MPRHTLLHSWRLQPFFYKYFTCGRMKEVHKWKSTMENVKAQRPERDRKTIGQREEEKQEERKKLNKNERKKEGKSRTLTFISLWKIAFAHTHSDMGMCMWKAKDILIRISHTLPVPLSADFVAKLYKCFSYYALSFISVKEIYWLFFFKEPLKLISIACNFIVALCCPSLATATQKVPSYLWITMKMCVYKMYWMRLQMTTTNIVIRIYIRWL